jgi:hypothetical protein
MAADQPVAMNVQAPTVNAPAAKPAVVEASHHRPVADGAVPRVVLRQMQPHALPLLVVLVVLVALMLVMLSTPWGERRCRWATAFNADGAACRSGSDDESTMGHGRMRQVAKSTASLADASDHPVSFSISCN